MSELATPLSRDLSRDELIAELRVLRPVFEDQAVTSMTLFGSRARRDNRPDSDIDLAIEVDESRKFSLLDLVGVGLTVEDHLGFPASILMRRSLKPDFQEELRRDGVDIF